MFMTEPNYWNGIGEHRIARRRLLRGAVVGGAGIAAAALIGCGSKKETKPAGGTSAPPQQAVQPASAQGKVGGRLRLTQAGEPPSFDLHQESTTYTNFVSSPSYNQLVRIDPADAIEKPTSIVPDLALSWEITPDGATYTFKLAQGVKYHDGTPFTAADVKASYERQITPPKGLVEPPRGGQLAPIKTMETPDPNTLVVKMGRPVSRLSMLPIFAQSWMAVYSEKDVKGGFDFKKKVNGTGPYVQTSYERGSKVVLDRNKNYFVKDRPYLDGIDVFIVPDPSTANASFQSGQLDYLQPSLTDLAALQKVLGDKVETATTLSYGYNVINFNVSKKPWNDPRVRQAIAMAMNRDDFIKIVSQGNGRPGAYLTDGGAWAISTDELLKIPGYQKFNDTTLAEVKKLLDAAGVSAASTPEIDMLTRAGASFAPLSLFVQDQLQKVGLKSKINTQETATAYDLLAKRNFDLCPWSHGFALDDPDAVFSEFYITKAPRNYSELSSPALDDLFLKQSMEQDATKRLELVKEMQRVGIPLYGKVVMAHTETRSLQWKRLKNYVTHASTYNNRRWQEAWLDG